MKENKGKKWLWAVLGAVLLLLVGIVGYLSGQLSSIKKEASSAKSVESSKVIKSSSSMVSSTPSSEDEQGLVDSSSANSQNNTSDNIHSGDSGNGLIDTKTNTFAGKYHNVHDLANDGYTVLTWLEKNMNMSEDEACAFTYQNYPFFYGREYGREGFLTSGDVQTINSWVARHDSSSDDSDDEDNNNETDTNNDVDTNNDEDD